MFDPLAWLCSFAEARDPEFDELSLRVVLGDGFEALTALNIVVRAANDPCVVCPECGDCHAEEVVAVLDAAGRTRNCIPCPAHGRVEVPAESLERWTIDWNAMARGVSAALDIGGQCAPLEPDRVWRLGRLKWQGLFRDVLLARGLPWTDGRRIAQRIAHATRPIVFVGDAPPTANAWTGRPPPVARLSQVATLDGGRLAIDREAVAAAVILGDASRAAGGGEASGHFGPPLKTRRPIRSEQPVSIDDGVLVAAYRQEGSVRKAADFLVRQLNMSVSKDRVARAVARSDGVSRAKRRA